MRERKKQRETQPLGKPLLSGRSFPAWPFLPSISASPQCPPPPLSPGVSGLSFLLSEEHTHRENTQRSGFRQRDLSSCLMAVAWSMSEVKGIHKSFIWERMAVALCC